MPRCKITLSVFFFSLRVKEKAALDTVVEALQNVTSEKKM
jgi:hypothetical protein